MKKILILTSILIITSCQKSSKNEINGFFEKLNILVTKRTIINLNIANVNTTRTIDGGAYVPKEAKNCKKGKCEMVPLSCRGVGCHPNMPYSPILKYEPGHPDVQKNGYVAYPNVDVKEEMNKLVRVSRAIDFLMKDLPVEHSFFFSEEVQEYFDRFPELNHDYNFRNLLRE